MTYTIVVTYNGAKWIRNTVKSVCNDSKVVVVDNNSTDNTLQILKREFVDIKIIELKKNIGFGRANNVGIKYCLDHGAEYFFLLNQDAYIQTNGLKELRSIAKNNNSYQILSPIHYNKDGSQIDRSFLLLCPRELLGRLAINSNLNFTIDSGFINAAAWFIERSVFEAIGGFNPLFFMYGEDVEFFNRFDFHNMKLGITASVKIYHDSGNNYYKPKIPGSIEYYRSFESHFLIEMLNPNTYYRLKWIRYTLYLLRKFLGKVFCFQYFKARLNMVKICISLKHIFNCMNYNLNKPGMHFLKEN